MRFSEETYKRLRSIIHPNLRKNIEKFRIENYFVFPHYHGCGKKNRNGTNKNINYKIGEICKKPTDYLNWKRMYDIPWKNIPHSIYFTRYGSNYGMNNFVKNKGRQWFDWDKKEYFDKSCWIKTEVEYFNNESSKSN